MSPPLFLRFFYLFIASFIKSACDDFDLHFATAVTKYKIRNIIILKRILSYYTYVYDCIRFIYFIIELPIPRTVYESIYNIRIDLASIF